jgi:hypothetical protein
MKFRIVNADLSTVLTRQLSQHVLGEKLPVVGEHLADASAIHGVNGW